MISIRDLWMSYRSTAGEQPVVRGVSLEIEPGKLYTLLGPSGCGKTTTLRCIAGLERPDSGEIRIGDEIVFSSARGIWVAPNDRNIGMVFQSYAIWPHMSVFDNVAFPLRHQKKRPTKAVTRDRVMAALAQVRLDRFADRQAPNLSGGQQQRLALARALVGEPRVLLLDEPLSNLDAKLREEMRVELREMVERLGVTTLFVTHEQVEALTMSDVMAVMRDGIIVQEGPPAEIYAEPQAPFVADFIGKTNFLAGRIVDIAASGIAGIDTEVGRLAARVRSGAHTGDAVTIAIRPENVTLADADGRNADGPNADGPNADGANIVAGTVETVSYLGNLLDCAVRVGTERILVQLHPSVSLDRGAPVRLHLAAEHCLAMMG
jgi:iron(III) transport system ATP-binding protein